MQDIPRKKDYPIYPVLCVTLILAMKVKIFTRGGKVKYCTIKILLYYGTGAVVMSISIIPMSWHKNNTRTNWDTRGGVFQTQLKATVFFNFQSWTIHKL